MDSPSKQLSPGNGRSSSSVRLAATSTRSHRTVLRGRDETAASLQASSLRSLWRTIRHGDASLVGQQVLQEDMQKRLSPRESPHPVRLGYPPFFRLRGWRPTGLDRSLCRRQVNQLVERMVVADVNSAEPGGQVTAPTQVLVPPFNPPGLHHDFLNFVSFYSAPRRARFRW